MGQQQLLLIVLGIIVVGVAVVAAISIFNTSQDASIKDELINHCSTIGTIAQQFYFKPAPMGGGNNSFNSGGIANTGYTIPLSMRTSLNGTYAEGGKTDTTFTITATPKPIAGKLYSFSSISVIVSPTRITTTINQ